jgi:hypothetical protein
VTPLRVTTSEDKAPCHVDKIELKNDLIYHVDFVETGALFQLTMRQLALKIHQDLRMLVEAPFKVEPIHVAGNPGFNTICITIDNKNPALQAEALGERILRLAIDALQPRSRCPRKS